MRIVEKLLYGICGIIGLMLLFILLCHFNPSLANGFAKGEEQAQIPAQELIKDNNPEIENKIVENIVLGTSKYEEPDISALKVPEKFFELMSMELPKGKMTEVSEERAKELKEDLTVGETGEDYTYDKKYYPYFYMLSEKEQRLYKQIHANSEILLDRFAPIDALATVGELQNAFTAFINDHPEIFWINTGYGYYIDPEKKIVEIDLSYNFTAKNLEDSKAKFDEAAKDIIYGSRGESGDYKKELYVHDALANLVTYDLNAPANQSAYSALVTNRTVCAGYARAFQYIMQQLEVPCFYCTGYSGQNHAWNIIKLEDDYYNVDVTWDDSKPLIYDYFNCSDAAYSDTHARKDLAVNLPACEGDKYSGLEKNHTEDKKTEDTTEEKPESDETKTQEIIEPNNKPVNTTTEEVTTVITMPQKVDYVIYDKLGEYYVECAHRMMEDNDKYVTFTLYVRDEDLWEEIKEEYIDGTYQDAYINRVLAERHSEGVKVSITGQEMNDGTYRIKHVYQLY